MNGGGHKSLSPTVLRQRKPLRVANGQVLADGEDCHLEKGVSGPSEENYGRKPWDAGAFGVGCL